MDLHTERLFLAPYSPVDLLVNAKPSQSWASQATWQITSNLRYKNGSRNISLHILYHKVTWKHKGREVCCPANCQQQCFHNTAKCFPLAAPRPSALGEWWAALQPVPLLPRGRWLADKRLLFTPYLFITPLPGWRSCFPDDVTHATTLLTHLLHSGVLTWPLKRSRRGISVLPLLFSWHHGIKHSLPEPRPVAAHCSSAGTLPQSLSLPGAPCFSLIKSTAEPEPRPADEREARAALAREAASSSSHCQRQIKIASRPRWLHKGRKKPGV